MANKQLKKLVKLLRHRATVNFFKMMVLEDMHFPGKPQAMNLFDKLDITEEDNILTMRAWEKWFDGSVDKLHHDSAEILDKLASEELWFKGGGNDERIDESQEQLFFQEMSHGGLVSKLLAPTKSENVKNLLYERAQDYKPLSLFHLHLDAIEINAITDDFREMEWNKIIEIASKRVLELIFENWGPRHGKIYSGFTSSFKHRWDAMGDEGREKLRETYSRFGSFYFEEKMQPGAEPNWSSIGVSDDVAAPHIYKALFAMAADYEFLIKERLYCWTFAFASAALAMHALAWSDRYATFGFHVTDEAVFWGAMRHIFFDSSSDEVDLFDLRRAMLRCATDWDKEALDVFSTARKIYRDELAILDLTPQNIIDIVDLATRVNPQVYRG